MLTTMSAVVVFVIGQLLYKLFVEPIHELKKTLADIASALTEYYSFHRLGWYNEHDQEVEMEESECNKVHERLTLLAAKLRANIALIPFLFCVAFSLWSSLLR
jgi:hypothetical protein